MKIFQKWQLISFSTHQNWFHVKSQWHENNQIFTLWSIDTRVPFMAPERGTRTEYEMKFYLRVLLRFLLIWRVAHFLYERNASTACHTTTIYVQNGTWLNVSEWYGNGLFGNIHRLPNPITVKPSYGKNKTYVTSNPALPRLPYFPTPEQDCVCGKTEVCR